MRMLKNRIHKTAGLLAVLLLAASACSPHQDTGLPTSTPKAAAAAASTVTENNLRLIVQSTDGVKGLDSQGVETALLPDIQPDQPAILFTPEDTSGASGQFALMDGGAMILHFFSSVSGGKEKSIELLSNPQLSEERQSACRQVLTSDSPPALVWSPDGKTAVFLAAIDKSCLELYLFDRMNLNVTRLSEGSRDAYQPTWSPDGQWVVYDEIDELNTFGLWSVTAVKAVRANGSQTVTLYEPQSYAEPRIGWASSTSFVVHSTRDRGPVDLREVSLEDGKSIPIFSGLFNNPVYNASTGEASFILSEVFSDPEVQPPGIYKASKDRPPAILASGDWRMLEWNAAAGVLLAVEASTGSAAINPAGQTVKFEGEDGLPVISSDGYVVAFFGHEDSNRPGLRVYSRDGDLLAEPASTGVDDLWQIPEEGLVFKQDGNLFLLEDPAWQPIPLIKNASLLGWLKNAAMP